MVIGHWSLVISESLPNNWQLKLTSKLSQYFLVFIPHHHLQKDCSNDNPQKEEKRHLLLTGMLILLLTILLC
ncbi:MAG TPA: hypothetical protein DEG17_21810 [Cyanobacteria bacterium UBA11149]|nr:hypothetical protein [Cyanobacteria bacterium UBA11367]HBE59383.1 hypothetical protein [Cyanobacteria bacterium UBA11366]HBK64861.1 hypothetical protein [Cyanobacteria bacterium UBA11166]HBR72310.1 hypothetical protein [Cyanobacteria bacterium UBA11159]HBS70347.1 hypothetical protein [Cyanobacteria bacterium UBA11153]HBW91421.1 hypothetical protein [Cyanobacteria bacterium UBA11149]HCA96278.1 hypothetical protein [Cyanobacteria bacterium UBA9226]